MFHMPCALCAIHQCLQLRSCQGKGEMNDKKNPRQARGTPYQNRAQLCSPSGNISASVPPISSSQLPPSTLSSLLHLFSPFNDLTQSSQVGRPGVENGRLLLFPWLPRAGCRPLPSLPSSHPLPPTPFTSPTFKPPVP